jgi:transcriptional regulator with XRE-family HTH domain
MQPRLALIAKMGHSPCGDRQYKMTNQFADAINRHLAENRLSRAELAARTGVSESWINKVLSGQLSASAKMLMKISSKTGIEFDAQPRKFFDFDLHEYRSTDVAHLEGSYQTIRPSFRTDGGIQCFETLIWWNSASDCLGRVDELSQVRDLGFLCP